MAKPLPTGTVSFLYTDIVDSTPLAEQNPDGMPALFARHNQILRESIETHRGYVFQIRGDAFCASFYTAAEALQAALQAQRRLLQDATNPAPVKVRMGIHTGAAQAGAEEETAGGYSGYLTLTRVQRVMSLACGGQILVSNPSAELLHGELPAGIELRDLGEQRLKGLLHPEHLWQVIAPDLPQDFPPFPSLNAIPNNLPVQLSSFIGREYEIAQVVRLLQRNRLITLTGVGGAGKTRLALQAAAEVLERFPDGAWLVELAPLADPRLVVQSVAQVMGLRELSGYPVDLALVNYLRAKRLLLLLDNCEHLTQACAQLADLLLRECPNLQILASSREALGIGGERVVKVPSLALPDLSDSPAVEEITNAEAVQLFIERARAVQPGFGLVGVGSGANAAHTAQTIARICQRLDGLPLAIELAAARVKMFSVDQILARLDDRFRLLTGGSRTALPRQQTLRALIDWSYDLLSEDERCVLRRLAVFTGGWTFEAALAVVDPDGELPEDLLDLLARLIDKSLVLVEDPPGEETTRYRFLETIRQYALEKLLQSGEAAELRTRHLQYFLEFAQAAEPALRGPEQLRWLDLFEIEHDNLRAALAWGLENDPKAALDLAGAIWVFWNMHGYASEGRGWLRRVLEQTEKEPQIQERMVARGKALLGCGLLAIDQGDNLAGKAAFEESAELARRANHKPLLVHSLGLLGTVETYLGEGKIHLASVEESVALAREIGDYWGLAISLGILSYYSWTRGDAETSAVYLQESVRLSRELGDPWNTGMVMLGFGLNAAQQGNYAEARARFEEGLEIFRKIGDKFRLNMAQSELAHIERRLGHYDQALSLYHETLLAWQNLGHRAAVAHQLECIAFIAVERGQYPRAACLIGAAEALREQTGNRMTVLERGEYEAKLNFLQTRLDEEAFAALRTRGRAMAMEAVIAYALEPEENA